MNNLCVYLRDVDVQGVHPGVLDPTVPVVPVPVSARPSCPPGPAIALVNLDEKFT